MHERLAERARAPRYTFGQASPLIGRPVNTVRRWSVGNARKRDGRAVRDAPLIGIDGAVGPGGLPLSFLNLLELQVLSQYRDDDASLQAIRGALRYAAEQLEVERPLLHVAFRVEGGHLFHEFAETEGGRTLAINASRGGQLALEDFVAGITGDIEYENDLARQWWFLGREHPMLVDTRVAGGQPITARTGVRLDAIASRQREGYSVAEIAQDTGAETDEVEAVLLVA